MLSQVACEDSEKLRAPCRFAIFLEVLLKPCVVEDAIQRLCLLNWDLGFVWCLARLHSCCNFFLIAFYFLLCILLSKTEGCQFRGLCCNLWNALQESGFK